MATCFDRISSDRNILPEQSTHSNQLAADGKNATDIVQQFLNLT